MSRLNWTVMSSVIGSSVLKFRHRASRAGKAQTMKLRLGVYGRSASCPSPQGQCLRAWIRKSDP